MCECYKFEKDNSIQQYEETCLCGNVYYIPNKDFNDFISLCHSNVVKEEIFKRRYPLDDIMIINNILSQILIKEDYEKLILTDYLREVFSNLIINSDKTKYYIDWEETYENTLKDFDKIIKKNIYNVDEKKLIKKLINLLVVYNNFIYEKLSPKKINKYPKVSFNLAQRIINV